MALVLLAFISSLSLSSSTVAGVYVGGFIPKTGPHIRKVSGASKLFSSGNMKFYDTYLDDPTRLCSFPNEPVGPCLEKSGLYANKEEEVDKFCYDLKIFNGWLEDPETDLTEKIFTLGGMKSSEDVTRAAFGKRDAAYLQTPVKEYCITAGAA